MSVGRSVPTFLLFDSHSYSVVVGQNHTFVGLISFTPRTCSDYNHLRYSETNADDVCSWWFRHAFLCGFTAAVAKWRRLLIFTEFMKWSLINKLIVSCKCVDLNLQFSGESHF
ncbi:hypothetical protein AVEN_109170-1 [Araneus ventricosus]|uniref:Uncharacterized protein n=1 Tax=Araneus ventricosus TaxID=182803 RepID=A0A4Y2JI33_ARAVE|nr:hypothetical protein AVEN_109170-1 [Araneus ventricosus]